MVTILEETDALSYAQQTPIAGFDDVPSYVSADARRPYSIGVQECNKGNYEEAVEQFDHTLKLDRNFPQAWYNKGTALGHLGRYHEAVEALDQALTLMPEFISARYNKGVALALGGRSQEALEVFERYLGENPHDVQGWLGKSMVLLDKSEVKAALVTLQEALDYADEDSSIWSITGVARARLGEFSQAQQAFHKAFDLKDGASNLDAISYKAWASSIITEGVSALINGKVGNFESAGFAYIDLLEKAQKDEAGLVVEDSLAKIKLMLQQRKRKGRQALAAFEELELFIDLMKIKDPLEGWRALGKALSERWPKGLSAVQAIREQRR